MADDVAADAEALLNAAIAVIAEEVDELAVMRTAPDDSAQRLLIAGEDIAHLARACLVLRRRAKTL